MPLPTQPHAAPSAPATLTPAQAHVFSSGNAELDALRSTLAQRLNLLDPGMLESWSAEELHTLQAELDEDDAEMARGDLPLLSDAELEAQALASVAAAPGTDASRPK